jgi:hypothetical protein
MAVVDAQTTPALKAKALIVVKKHVAVWRLLGIIHALARPSRMLALTEVAMLETVCQEYGKAFRATCIPAPIFRCLCENEAVA